MVERSIDLEVVLEVLGILVLEVQVDSNVLDNRPDCILESFAEGSSFEEGLDPLCLNRMLKIDSDVDSLELPKYGLEPGG